jgi:hypothetical protein
MVSSCHGRLIGRFRVGSTASKQKAIHLSQLLDLGTL